MRSRLNLLENSYDYLINPFYLYQEADEYRINEKEKSNIKKIKYKWDSYYGKIIKLDRRICKVK